MGYSKNRLALEVINGDVTKINYSTNVNMTLCLVLTLCPNIASMLCPLNFNYLDNIIKTILISEKSLKDAIKSTDLNRIVAFGIMSITKESEFELNSVLSKTLISVKKYLDLIALSVSIENELKKNDKDLIESLDYNQLQDLIGYITVIYVCVISSISKSNDLEMYITEDNYARMTDIKFYSLNANNVAFKVSIETTEYEVFHRPY